VSQKSGRTGKFEDFIDRMEHYKDKKEEKIKQLDDHINKDLTFKPKTYSKHEFASKYYERQLKKLQDQ
jgi:hypothetical protein